MESTQRAELGSNTTEDVWFDSRVERDERSEFFFARAQKPILSFGCLAKQGYWSDLRTDAGALHVPDNSQIQLHNEGSLFFVEGRLMSPLMTTGVSDAVAQAANADWTARAERRG